MSEVAISKNKYGERTVEVTVSFKMKIEIDRYGDDMVPADATTMPLGEAKEFTKGELFDMSPNDLWEKVMNSATLNFETND